MICPKYVSSLKINQSKDMFQSHLLISSFFFSGSRNGTCYTATECSAKSGVASGNCAAG